MPVTGYAVYGPVGVGVDRRLFDAQFSALFGPIGSEDVPGYEETLVAALRDNVRSGDRVVIVGGGAGVTCAIAGLLVGERGRVTCFEGGADCLPAIQRTLERNGVADRVALRHAVVGPMIGVYGDAGNPEEVSPADLPDCDLLELDCEGSEIEILRGLVLRPRVILVESHGMNGAPTHLCASLLERLGYRVEELGYAEPRLLDQCRINDICILAGVRDEAT